MDALAPRWRVLAPDTLGAGHGPPWPARADVRLADEVALLEPLRSRVSGPLHVVGHSYGGALALKLALAWPGRVASLVLFEPTLFALLLQQQPGHPAVAGIVGTVQGAAAAVDRGDLDAAAERFIDYWMGAGAWAEMPDARRARVAASVRNVRGWADALMLEPATLDDLRALPMPITLLAGAESPESARAVLRLLAAALPQARMLELAGLGHMGPVTHPGVVNPVIEAALAQAA